MRTAIKASSETSCVVRAPRGTTLSCKGWQQEAALRMLMNNLDPEVAERPADLVVYGGRGKAARNWACFHAIVRALRGLENDETLLVQSGKPVAVFRTHEYAPRVLIANSNLVGRWATWEVFNELEQKGLMMYGQMTAGSWIYIGTQGILQGTYETFAEAARQHFGGSLKGRLVVTAGLGGMGGAQPLAATMNEAAFLAVEVDPKRIAMRLKTRYLDAMETDLDTALEKVLTAKEKGQALSVGLLGNAADIIPELARRRIAVDVLTDQTSAHDPLTGYIPQGLSLEEAAKMRVTNPQEHIRRAMESMAVHVRAMLELKAQGAVTFDYGNNIRTMAFQSGVKDAYDIPGFVPAFIRPLFCEGRGPFRWAALSGEASDIAATDPESRWSRPITSGALTRPLRTRSLKARPARSRSPYPSQQMRAGRPWNATFWRAIVIQRCSPSFSGNSDSTASSVAAMSAGSPDSAAHRNGPLPSQNSGRMYAGTKPGNPYASCSPARNAWVRMLLP